MRAPTARAYKLQFLYALARYAESRALVTNQAIVLDAWDGAELPAIPELEAADLESATSLLNWEYEQVFGLELRDCGQLGAVPGIQNNGLVSH